MTRGGLLLVRRGLVLAGLAVVVWSVSRVIRLLAGDDSVVTAGDPHGYLAIFSLVLLPVLVFAAVALGHDTADLWRRRVPHRVGSGVALVVSAPLAGQFALGAAATGVATIVTVLLWRHRTRRAATRA